MSDHITISPDQLETAIEKMIQEYGDEIVDKMPDIVKATAKDTVKDLKGRAADLFGGTKYKKSFKAKQTVSTGGKTVYTVHTTEYRIAHLLEHGHKIKTRAGLIKGTTQAKPHWSPAEKAAVKEMEKKVMLAIEETK